MTIRYVGIGGNDGNSGLTWALRKLTLDGVEDTPVVAGDTVYVGPGTYRESLTVDISGPGMITYIGDVSGENTDEVGGIVRITGSDNDQSAARANCISASGKDYRTFRGFHFDMVSSIMIDADNCENWIIEDCTFECGVGAVMAISCTGLDQADWTLRRSWFWGWKDSQVCVEFDHTAAVDDSGHLVENCFFQGGYSISVDDVGSVQIENCTFTGGSTGVIHWGAIGAGQETDVYNCLFFGLKTALWATVAGGDMIEDYCTFNSNTADRTNVAIGGNSQTYPAALRPTLFLDGFIYPRYWGSLADWSAVAGIAGSTPAADDLFGVTRPVTNAKKSWGAAQFMDMERETGTKRTGVSSLVLHDAGRHQIWVPITNVETTIKVYVYREANYAGNNPQMIIKQPGQADDVTTDAAAASQWNLLTTTLTPAAVPPYVIVELVSRNTAVALAYETFFDDLDVS